MPRPMNSAAPQTQVRTIQSLNSSSRLFLISCSKAVSFMLEGGGTDCIRGALYPAPAVSGKYSRLENIPCAGRDRNVPVGVFSEQVVIHFVLVTRTQSSP